MLHEHIAASEGFALGRVCCPSREWSAVLAAWQLTWRLVLGPNIPQVVGKELYALPVDLFLKFDPELSAIAQEYAADNEVRQLCNHVCGLLNGGLHGKMSPNSAPLGRGSGDDAPEYSAL